MWVSSEKKSKYGDRKKKEQGQQKSKTKVALLRVFGGSDARTKRMNER
jgi:hypothetical protein